METYYPPDGSPVGNNPHPGLDNNPGIDAKLFSDSHPYIANAYPGAQQAVERVVKEAERRALYQRLLNDPDYKDVQYNPQTGGLKATHVKHNEHPNDKKKYFDDMTGDDLENEAIDIIFGKGHTVIARQENTIREIVDGIIIFNHELDTILDGRLMDIKSITENRDSYEYALLKKNGQLLEFNIEHNTQADTILLYFHDASYYEEKKITDSFSKLKALHKPAVDEDGKGIMDENGKQVYTDELFDIIIKHVICVTKTGIWKEFDL